MNIDGGTLIALRAFHHTPTAPSISSAQEEWMDGALCAQIDTELFFPAIGGHAVTAKRICAACPVTSACLEYALADKDLCGVWGGTGERARDRMRAAREATR